MDPRIDSRHFTRLETAARRLAATVAVLGCLVLVGSVSGLATMNASPAIAFVLSAVPLARRRDPGSRRLAIAGGCAAALVALIGFLTVPGATALGLLMLGLAELALDRPSAVAVGQWLGVGVAFLGVLNLVGHALSASRPRPPLQSGPGVRRDGAPHGRGIRPRRGGRAVRAA